MANTNFSQPHPNGQTPGDVFALVLSRLSTGSPFATAPGAFQGYEQIAQLGDWQIGLNYVNKVLSLKANTRTEALPLLPLATRQAPHQYTVICDRASFDRWIAPIAPAEPVAFDLLVASRSFGASDTGEVYSRVTWWKEAGQPKQTPKGRITLVDLLPSLEGFALVETQKTSSEVIRKYVKEATR